MAKMTEVSGVLKQLEDFDVKDLESVIAKAEDLIASKQMDSLKLGQEVKVKMRDGSTVKGIIYSLSLDGIVVNGQFGKRNKKTVQAGDLIL